MLLVRISVYDKTPAERRRIIAASVYDAMRATLGVPDGDRFIFLTGYSAGDLSVDTHYMNMQRTEDFVLIHVTLRSGRSVEVKQSFYREVVHLLEQRAAIAPDNIMIVLSPNGLEDWSFGRGEAQYVVNPPDPAEVSR